MAIVRGEATCFPTNVFPPYKQKQVQSMRSAMTLISRILPLLLAIPVCIEPLADIFDVAVNDPENSHLPLVVLSIVWLIRQRRHRLSNWFLHHHSVGIALIAVGLLIQHSGPRYAFEAAWHGGAICVLIGAVVAVFGLEVILRFPGPVLAAFMLIPVPGLIRQMTSIPIQGWSCQAVDILLGFVGVPVERFGNHLQINGVQVAIAEACDGMRMLYATVVVAFTALFVFHMRNRIRLVILVGCPFLILLVNIMRLVLTVLLFGYASSEVAAIFHDAAGWGMVIGVMALVLTINNRFALIEDQNSRTDITSRTQTSTTSLDRMMPALAPALLVFMIWNNQTETALGVEIERHHQLTKKAVTMVPYCIGDWLGTDVEFTDSENRMLRPTAAIRRKYIHSATGESFELMFMYCRDPRSIVGHYPAVCYPAHGWKSVTQVDATWPVGAGTINGREYQFELTNGGKTHRMCVFDSLMLNHGVTTGDMQRAAAAAANSELRRYGIAQVRMAFSNDNTADNRAIVSDVLTHVFQWRVSRGNGCEAF